MNDVHALAAIAVMLLLSFTNKSKAGNLDSCLWIICVSSTKVFQAMQKISLFFLHLLLYIERRIRLWFDHFVLVKFFHNIIVRRCLMPVNAFPAYRPIAVFFVTLALTNALYSRYQAVKRCNRNYLKVGGSTDFLLRLVTS